MNQEHKSKSWAFAIRGFPLFIGFHIAHMLIYNHYDSMPIGSYFQKGIDPLSPGAVVRMMDKPTLIILGSQPSHRNLKKRLEIS